MEMGVDLGVVKVVVVVCSNDEVGDGVGVV